MGHGPKQIFFVISSNYLNTFILDLPVRLLLLMRCGRLVFSKINIISVTGSNFISIIISSLNKKRFLEALPIYVNFA